MSKKATEQSINQRAGTEWVVSPPDEVHPSLGGEAIKKISELLHAPSQEAVRDMLVALRRHQKWSQTFAAAVLGVTEGAITKWESGARKPNGAAAKLIFLLYTQIVEKQDRIKNCWDLATWGGVPCRNSMRLIAIAGTYWVSNNIIDEISRTPAERLRPELRQLLGISDLAKSD